MTHFEDTIFALASAHGRSGVNVLRLSGPSVRNIVRVLAGNIPLPRRAVLKTIMHPSTQVVIDKALVLFFEAPHSYTGEDVVEFHVHGGRAILNAMIEVFRSFPKTRLAEAGEFTRRAFESGKMDLTEAEAIADLVDAETEAQRKQALRQMEGAIGAVAKVWGERLRKILAHSEAVIDFSDEELPENLEAKQEALIRELANEIETKIQDGHTGERVREGFRVTLLGAPNAGKSSLLNALAAREVAIVSPVAGTTRDIIDISLDLGGYAVTLSDTAGLHEASKDLIEQEGIRRALAKANVSDLKILLVDGTHEEKEKQALKAYEDASSLWVVNKMDLLPNKAFSEKEIALSAKTGEGLDRLVKALIERVGCANGGEAVLVTRARHREALEEVVAQLRAALAVSEAALRAENLRLAMRAMGKLVGKVDVEDLLDVIFHDFCIGK